MNLPRPFDPAADPEGKPEWSESFTEDYANADDQTRRIILLRTGYDPAHEDEAFRLFPELASTLSGQDNCAQEHQQNKRHIQLPRKTLLPFVKRFWKLFCGLAVIVSFFTWDLIFRFVSWTLSFLP